MRWVLAWLSAVALAATGCSAPSSSDEEGRADPALARACAGRAQWALRPMSRSDARECADAFRAAGDPRFRRGAETVRIHDDGEAWIVSYHPRSRDAVGGGAIVLVSKHATLIVGSLQSQ
jgi:hypothetical protein